MGRRHLQQAGLPNPCSKFDPNPFQLDECFEQPVQLNAPKINECGVFLSARGARRARKLARLSSRLDPYGTSATSSLKDLQTLVSNIFDQSFKSSSPTVPVKRLSHQESAYHDNDLLCGAPIPLARTVACETFTTNRCVLYSRTSVI